MSMFGGAFHWRGRIVAFMAAAVVAAVSQRAAADTADWLLMSTFDCYVNGCQYENAVLRYDLSTGAFLGVHIPYVPGPTGMAIHPTRGTLLVASRSSNTINEYNARTGAYIQTFVWSGVEGLNLPQGLLFHPNGNLLVTSSQSAGEPDAFNGVLEFDGDDGSFVRAFIDGGYLGQGCGAQKCLFGASAMAFGPNGNLYVVSSSNDMVIEYNGNTGSYVGAFTSSQLDFPTGIAIRPTGTTRAGNILVTSRYRNPANVNDTDKILEFDKTSRALINPGGTFASGLVKPGPLYMHPGGYLLVDDRSLTETDPTYADRIIKLNRDTGAFLGNFLQPGDTRLHQATAMLKITVTVGNVSDDHDGDGDVDMKDFGGFQRCFGPTPNGACLSAFDDNVDNVVNNNDLGTFRLQFTGPQH